MKYNPQVRWNFESRYTIPNDDLKYEHSICTTIYIKIPILYAQDSGESKNKNIVILLQLNNDMNRNEKIMIKSVK